MWPEGDTEETPRLAAVFTWGTGAQADLNRENCFVSPQTGDRDPGVCRVATGGRGGSTGWLTQEARDSERSVLREVTFGSTTWEAGRVRPSGGLHGRLPAWTLFALRGPGHRSPSPSAAGPAGQPRAGSPALVFSAISSLAWPWAPSCPVSALGSLPCPLRCPWPRRTAPPKRPKSWPRTPLPGSWQSPRESPWGPMRERGSVGRCALRDEGASHPPTVPGPTRDTFLYLLVWRTEQDVERRRPGHS